MGIILWKNTMALLSTLAALVIIVHTEEDPNIVNRQDLKPRVLDTGTPIYDEPLKTLDAKSETNQTILGDTWIVNSSEEPPRRRRRMRKRRPQSESTEADAQTDVHFYNEEPRATFSESESSNIYRSRDRPKRRRKKPEAMPRRWQNDDAVTERPSRLVVHTRKRPLTDNDENLSEFSNDRSDTIKSVKTESDHLVSIKEIIRKNHEKKIENSSEKEEIYSDYETSDNSDSSKLESESSKPTSIVRHRESNKERVNIQSPIRDDKSLSEFSFETLGYIPKKTNEAIPNKEKTLDSNNSIRVNDNIFDESEKGKVNGPIDPVTLKELLKKSNGSSLSEILQQHNLSLPDLLHGRPNALTLLRKNDLPQNRSKEEHKSLDFVTSDNNLEKNRSESEASKLLEPQTGITVSEAVNNTNTKKPEITFSAQTTSKTIDKELILQTTTEKSLWENIEVKQNEPRVQMKRRFQPNARKKLRVKPVINNNNSFKGQLSRDFISINNRKYLNLTDRHDTKAKEWKDVISLLTNLPGRATPTEKVETKAITTSTIKPNETTTEIDDTNDNYSTIFTTQSENTATTEYEMVTDKEFVTQDATIFTDTIATTIAEVTEKTKVFKPRTRYPSMIKQTSKSLMKKPYSRLRGMQRYSTDSVPDEIIKDLFGTANTVPVSKFPRTQTQKTTTYQDIEDFTHLEDFMTTTDIADIEQSTKPSTPLRSMSITSISTTEEIAKLEIEEIFNDTMTSARLTKILHERNMTLNELVAHRERGSSHVHLADIFHNASREPNPPEPFLSKSLIEPISKETYPLRALLEANLHDPAIKASTLDPMMIPEHSNIQVVMDFGNNVNENSENMGIVSLFRKITENDYNSNQSQSIPALEGTTAIVTIAANSQEREGRHMDANQDGVSWNEIFSLTRNTENNTTEEITHGQFTGNKEIILDRDIDGDGLIVLEDLRNMKDFDINIDSVSNENFNVYKKTDFITNDTNNPSGILSTEQNSAKSVTVATACIVGVAMALFLLTYAVFKWKHQSTLIKQKDTAHDRIPTPVFENRKGDKNNCSMRSISPMLSSNIYTLNTHDSHTEKDSPEYNLWDRKPFQ